MSSESSVNARGRGDRTSGKRERRGEEVQWKGRRGGSGSDRERISGKTTGRNGSGGRGRNGRERREGGWHLMMCDWWWLVRVVTQDLVWHGMALLGWGFRDSLLLVIIPYCP